ncbi:MAG: alpha-galactosidase [Lachnospiraceae bacterium]|nr:alpha-galactosidase [Lachnospiraceae bacterium]
MAIVYNPEKRTISLHTAKTTYQMKIGNLNYVKHLYYGATIPDEDLIYLVRRYDRGFSGNPYDSLAERTFSLDAQPQEFTTQQQGDFRINSIEVQNADGSFSFNGRYKSHRIYHGAFTLNGLPTAFAAENDTVDTLELVIEDAVTKVQVTLLYSVFEEADIIMRAARVHNAGNAAIQLKRIMSVNMDYMNGRNLDLLSLPGRYGQERQVERQPLTHHVHKIRSGRGISSHQQNPFIALMDRNTNEDAGACYGFALMYSGSFLAEVELDQYDQARLVMGINDRLFNYTVNPGEDFDAPAVLMTYTHKGLAKMSHNFHHFFRNNLNRSKFVRDMQRPILINTWEAAFFNFDDQKLVEIAKAAKDMGVEMIVMDDGWFGKRDDDNSGLGDWVVNENKIRCGLTELVRQINDLGMKFGIWFEPEMVSEDSDLFRAHPDWVMEIPGRRAVRSRNQLVLDVGRKEVQDYLIESINRILDSANIYYVKWDINRAITDLWSNVLPADRQGEVTHRYVLGLYRIMDGIIKTHPDILFEGCAGGGGRFDPAMLTYFIQYWSSDNTKPLDNLKLHYGSSFLYPICTMGAHVSAASPMVPLETKAAIAMCGTFGYELDATKLKKKEIRACKKMSDLYHKYYDLNFFGDYYRLANPFEQVNLVAWESVSKDKREALVTVVTVNLTVNGPQEYIHCKGLSPNTRYHLQGGGYDLVISGMALMHAGIPIPREVPEFSAFLYHIQALDE